MSTMKIFGLTAAALFCVSLAQPARAAADCPTDRAQGDEQVVGGAAPNADQRETTLTDSSGFIAQTSMPAAVGTHAGLSVDRVTGARDAVEPNLMPSGCYEIGWPWNVYCCCEFGICSCMPM